MPSPRRHSVGDARKYGRPLLRLPRKERKRRRNTGMAVSSLRTGVFAVCVTVRILHAANKKWHIINQN